MKRKQWIKMKCKRSVALAIATMIFASDAMQGGYVYAKEEDVVIEEEQEADTDSSKKVETKKEDMGEKEEYEEDKEKQDEKEEISEEKEIEEKIVESSKKAFHAEQKIGHTRIEVDAPEGVFPEDTQLRVTLLNGNKAKQKVEKSIEEELEKDAPSNTTYELMGMNAYDITILSHGEEIQPNTDAGEVTVKFSDVTIQTEGDTTDEVSYLKVFHIADDKERAQEMETEKDSVHEEISFDTEHFSIYAIAAVGGTITYSGGSQGNCTLPAGEYTILARGAGGAAAYDTCFQPGGNGGYVSGKFRFDKEVTLSYIVGTGGSTHPGRDANQEGSNGHPGGGRGYLRPGGNGAASGGGGGYTAISANGEYLMVAGGGAGGDTSSDRGGVAGGNGGSGGGMSGMSAADGSYIKEKRASYYATGGGGGGYRGGSIHIGGTSYLSSKATEPTLLTGQGASGGKSNGAAGSGGSITITWNKCSHGKESIVYKSLQDNSTHRIVCSACEDVISESVACTDEDENGYCDYCNQLLTPYFRDNKQITKKLVYASQGITELHVNPCIMEGFVGELQWYCDIDGEQKLLEGERSETLKIKEETLDAGTYEYYCKMTYKGKVEGIRVSAKKILEVEKADAFLVFEEKKLDTVYGSKSAKLTYYITADEEGKEMLLNDQEHGGKLTCFSSDPSVVEVSAAFTSNNTGNIHVSVKNAGTATINCMMSEGKNYNEIERCTLEVTVDKGKVTEFRIVNAPKTLRYGDQKVSMTYRYWGDNEPADGVLKAMVETTSQDDKQQVIKAELQDDGKTVYITPVNAGKARVILSVEQEGRNYKTPLASGLEGNQILTEEIEVTKAEGVITFAEELNDNNLTLRKKYNDPTDHGTRTVAFSYNANLDQNHYGKGTLQVRMSEADCVLAKIQAGEKALVLEPIKAGDGTLTLFASEGANYTSCKRDIQIKVINSVKSGNVFWDFDEIGEKDVAIKDIWSEAPDVIPENLEIPKDFVIDGVNRTVSTIRTGTFQKETGLKTLFVPSTVTVIEPNAIDKSIKIITEPGSAAESYAKKNGNILAMKKDGYSYEVVRKDDEWVADSFKPISSIPTVKIPNEIDGYPIIGIDQDTITSETEQIILQNEQIQLRPEWLVVVNKDIQVERKQDSFKLSRTEQGTFVISDYLVKDKTGIIIVPEQIMGYPVVSVSRWLVDNTTEAVVLKGEITELPQQLIWKKDIKIVVIKDSIAEETARTNAFEKILFLPLGGIEVELSADAISVTGGQVDISKIVITGYWDKEKTKKGNILWEDLTTIPKDLTVHQQGVNKYIIGYFGVYSYFVINGYLPQSNHKEHNDKNKGNVSIKDLDSWQQHFDEIVKNVTEEDMLKLVDTNTLHLGRQAVEELYHNKLQQMTKNNRNQLLTSELPKLSERELHEVIERIEEGESVALGEEGYLQTIEEEKGDYNRLYDRLKEKDETSKMIILLINLLIVALLVIGIYINAKMRGKRKEAHWNERESNL